MRITLVCSVLVLVIGFAPDPANAGVFDWLRDKLRRKGKSTTCSREHGHQPGCRHHQPTGCNTPRRPQAGCSGRHVETTCLGTGHPARGCQNTTSVYPTPNTVLRPPALPPVARRPVVAYPPRPRAAPAMPAPRVTLLPPARSVVPPPIQYRQRVIVHPQPMTVWQTMLVDEGHYRWVPRIVARTVPRTVYRNQLGDRTIPVQSTPATTLSLPTSTTSTVPLITIPGPSATATADHEPPGPVAQPRLRRTTAARVWQARHRFGR